MDKVISKLVAILGIAICHASFAITELGVHFIVDTELGSKSYTMRQVDRIVSEINDYYSGSGVDIRITAVKVSHIPLNNNFRYTLDDIITGNPDHYDDISGYTLTHKTARRSGDYGASYVYALVADGDAFCGRASQVNHGSENDDGLPDFIPHLSIGKLKYRTAVSRLSCDSDTVAHELGHLMGLAHGDKIAQCRRSNSHKRAISTRAKGWAEGNCDGRYQTGEFGTLMTGNWAPSEIGAIKAPFFSSPNVRSIYCGADRICGDKRNGFAVAEMNYYARAYGNLLPITPIDYGGD